MDYCYLVAAVKVYHLDLHHRKNGTTRHTRSILHRKIPNASQRYNPIF